MTDDLMQIHMEGPSMDQIDPSPNVDHRLTSKQSR